MRGSWLLLLVSVIAGSYSPSRAEDRGPGEYTLPLFGSYAINRDSEGAPRLGMGTHQLLDGYPSGGEILVANLKQFAVSGRVIVGTTEKGYFVLDTSQSDREVKTFADAESWRAGLRSAGVPTNIQLNDPDAVAATRPDQQIHPYAYWIMKGRLGLTDDDWAAIVELLGLMGMVLWGLLVPSRHSPLLVGVLLGLDVDILAQIVIAGGGGGAFVGLLLFPAFYCVAGQIARLVRWWFWERRRGSSKLASGASQVC